MPVETSWILFTAWSIRSRMDLASFKKALPAGVSVIGRLVLSKSGNIKLIGCFREAAALGGGHEISELVCIHNGNFLSKNSVSPEEYT